MTATAKSTFEAGEDGDLGFEKGETIVVRLPSDSRLQEVCLTVGACGTCEPVG